MQLESKSDFQSCLFPDGPINATYITVYNANRQNGPDGELDDISGYAFVQDPAEPGQLYAFLDGGDPDGGECKYALPSFHLGSCLLPFDVCHRLP